MIFNNIINFFILSLFLFLASCNSIDLLSKKEVIDLSIDTPLEKNFIIDLNPHTINNKNFNDYYDYFYLDNDNFNLVKLKTLNTFEKKITESKPLISFIHNDKFISLNYKSQLKIYTLDSFELINLIELNLSIDEDKYFPTSIAKIDNEFFISLSNGKITKFNLDGKILWNVNLNDIIKTPIKIFENNLIVILSDKILLINSLTGKIEFEFSYEGKDIFQSEGGKILDYNHLLYFILPNSSIGEIDTIFGEKNNTPVSLRY